MDEQPTRADYAQRHGLALCLKAHEVYRVDASLLALLDESRRDAITSRCRTLRSTNGAGEAARFLETLALGVRADLAPRDLRPTRPL